MERSSCFWGLHGAATQLYVLLPKTASLWAFAEVLMGVRYDRSAAV